VKRGSQVMLKVATVVLTILPLFAASLPAQAPKDYRQSIETWREGRIARLTAPDGWLTLVGLYWLSPGTNRFGTASDNDIVFPASSGAPAHVGRFDLSAGQVTVTVTQGDVRIEGKPVHHLELASDASGNPSELRLGHLLFYVIKRGDRLGIRLKDSQAAARIHFKGIEHYPVDPKWRVVARFEPYRPPKIIPIATEAGTVAREPSPGALVFEHRGKTYRLDSLTEEGTKDFFIIFRDGTSGRTTYGGGRSLYAPPPSPDGTTVLDFNKAYNQPCAFTPFATCSIPPPQNVLPFAVTAGEKTYPAP